jgi:hypothetical protein
MDDPRLSSYCRHPSVAQPGKRQVVAAMRERRGRTLAQMRQVSPPLSQLFFKLMQRDLAAARALFGARSRLSVPIVALRAVRVSPSPAAVEEPGNGGFDERRDLLDRWRLAQAQRALDMVISP